jgi:hypothetical protein
VANLQVKNVPADLDRRLRKAARRRGCTLRDLVLEAVRRELSREELHERLASRKKVDLGRTAARIVDEVRAERDAELGR